MKRLLVLALLLASPAFAANFTASDFFERLSPEVPRAKSLPSKVTFQPARISAAELRDLLKSSWRIEGTCSGRPVDKAKEVAFANAEGFSLVRTVFRFLSEWEYELIQFNEEKGTRATAKIPYLAKVIDEEKGLLHMKSPNYIESLYQAHTIVETGELVLLDKSEKLADRFLVFCGKGENYFFVFVKEPTS